MRYIKLSILIIGIVAGCGRRVDTGAGTAPSFDETLQRHLSAVQRADLEQLEPTVADDVTLILPDGRRLTTRTAFMDLHKNWFAEKNWTWTPRVLSLTSVDSLAYASVQYTYTEQDSAGHWGEGRNNYLLLVFRNGTSGWQLVYDQNTTIR